MDQNLDIFEQVFRSVVKEYRDGREHSILGCRACFKVGGIVGRAVTMSFTPSIGVLPLWTALAMNCNLPFYVTNLLYNFIDFCNNKLCL